MKVAQQDDDRVCCRGRHDGDCVTVVRTRSRPHRRVRRSTLVRW